MKKQTVPTEKKKLDHWSYSAWATLKQCHYKFYCMQILGMKETTVGPALIRGSKIHKNAEFYLKGDVPKLMPDFKGLKSHYKQLRDADPVVEEFWGVSSKWKPMSYGSWVVMKMDAAIKPCKLTRNRLFIQDVKSGREYPGHKDQGSLYAAIGDRIHPKNSGVDVEFWYVDAPIPEDEFEPDLRVARFEFSPRQVVHAREYWTEEGLKTLKPRKVYMPNPSDDACRFCFLRTDKGGPCSAWKTLRNLR